jgi:hypothetical protein
MPQPAYPPALAAAAIADDFYQRRLPATPSGLVPMPPASATVAAAVDAAFWASLRPEEGRPPRVSLALLPPARAGQPMPFERSIPLGADALARLAPAVEGPGIHLGLWGEEGNLRVWGAVRVLPEFCLVVEVIEPGLLVLKHRRGEGEKFGNIAVLRGDEIRVLDEGDGSMPGRPALLGDLLGSDTLVPWEGGGGMLTQLAVAMRRHRHGASLLVVPSGTAAWRESIVRPTAYAIEPAFTVLAELLERKDVEEVDDEIRTLADTIAGLTAVDGAAILTQRFELLAFGATIRRREGYASVDQVLVTEPVVGNVPARASATELGGTRHLSAAQFVHDQQDAVAFVASQDGRFTVFAWSPGKRMVHAHRIEVLLF